MNLNKNVINYLLLKSTSSTKNIIYSASSYSKPLCFFLLLSTEDILKNAGKQTVDGPH